MTKLTNIRHQSVRIISGGISGSGKRQMITSLLIRFNGTYDIGMHVIDPKNLLDCSPNSGER